MNQVEILIFTPKSCSVRRSCHFWSYNDGIKSLLLGPETMLVLGLMKYTSSSYDSQRLFPEIPTQKVLTCVPERELAGDAVDRDDEPQSEHLRRKHML